VVTLLIQLGTDALTAVLQCANTRTAPSATVTARIKGACDIGKQQQGGHGRTVTPQELQQCHSVL
jgi:hypothetical protein